MLSTIEAIVFWSTVIIALLGGFSTLTARCLEQCHHHSAGMWLFFTSMFLVACVTLTALAAGMGCWISGGATLLFMALVGTIDLGTTQPGEV